MYCLVYTACVKAFRLQDLIGYKYTNNCANRFKMIEKMLSDNHVAKQCPYMEDDTGD